MSANTECLVTGCFRRPPGTCPRNLWQNENRRIFVDAALTHTSTFPCFTSGPNITLCPDSICRVIWSSQARPTRLGITSTSSLYGEPKDQASSCTNHVRVGVPSNQLNLYPHLYFCSRCNLPPIDTHKHPCALLAPNVIMFGYNDDPQLNCLRPVRLPPSLPTSTSEDLVPLWLSFLAAPTDPSTTFPLRQRTVPRLLYLSAPASRHPNSYSTQPIPAARRP